MATLLVETFLTVVNEYRTGKLSQSEALSKLDKEYKSAISENEKKKADILEKHRFYRYVPGGPDQLISLYDTSMNRTSESERKEYEIIYKRIINDFLSGVDIPPNEWETITQLDFDLANVAIYQERDTIAELCQEERETTEKYKNVVAEIQKEIIQNKFIPEMIKEGLLSKDGKTVLININNIADFLVIKGQKVTTRLLLDLGLRKDDGKSYSKRACEHAVNLANTNGTLNDGQVFQEESFTRKRKKTT